MTSVPSTTGASPDGVHPTSGIPVGSPNYEALQAPVNRADATDLVLEMRRRGVALDRGQSLRSTVMAAFVLIVWVIVSYATIKFFDFALTTPGSLVPAIPIAIGSIVWLVLAALFLNYLHITIRLPTSAVATLRMWKFAGENGFRFVPSTRNPRFAGMLFELGSRRTTYNRLVTTRSPRIQIFNYECFVALGTRRWGVMSLELGRPLPHMVLQATKNKNLGGRAIPMLFVPNQVLSLEGDFDRYFTLFCPHEYERDALYLFTPDLMALLIDEASAFDVEIVDNTMFIYAPRPFRLTAQATYERLFRIADLVGSKTLKQSGRYRDERASSAADQLSPGRRVPLPAPSHPASHLPSVSPQGRRLRMRATASVAGAAMLCGVAVLVVHLLHLV